MDGIKREFENIYGQSLAQFIEVNVPFLAVENIIVLLSDLKWKNSFKNFFALECKDMNWFSYSNLLLPCLIVWFLCLQNDTSGDYKKMLLALIS